MKKTLKWIQGYLLGLISTLAIYHLIATFCYSYRHPEMTQMQVMQNAGDAWMWK